MTDLGNKLKKRGVRAVRAVYQAAENRILVAEGRKAVRRKARVVAAVATKAAKAALAVGVLTAAVVVTREVKKRRVPG